MLDIIKGRVEIEEFLKVLDKRGNTDEGEYIQIVKKILDDVKKNKDKALLSYTNKFDDENLKLEDIRIPKEVLKEAYDSLEDDLKEVLGLAKHRIYGYHNLQKRETWLKEVSEGEFLGQKISPIESVGVYVPGGKASYPSSVFMNVMPAKVAGVKKIIMVTPAPKGYLNPLVLAAAYLCEVDEVYKVGGAQAIAALAYGTETIPKVDKIVGPGNIYVALAKKEVFGTVGIDSIAGPSEILVLADETANYKFCAADLLGQAEHDELASSILITTSEDFANKVREYALELYHNSLRKEILSRSLLNYSRIIIVPSIEEMISLANLIAPEHLEICLEEPMDYVSRIDHAGAMFIGNYTPESLGDYLAGPNHVLPTVKTSRFFSPLGVDDFIKKTSLLSFSKEASIRLADYVKKFADSEGLQMHGISAIIRKEE